MCNIGNYGASYEFYQARQDFREARQETREANQHFANAREKYQQADNLPKGIFGFAFEGERNRLRAEGDREMARGREDLADAREARQEGNQHLANGYAADLAYVYGGLGGCGSL
jgi:hypothetical protein